MKYLSINKALPFILLLLHSVQAISQKVPVMVVKTDQAAASQWLILDEYYRLIFTGDEYYREDTVYFSLEAGKRYLLQVSVTDIINPDTTLYSLWLNGDPVLLITSDTEPGDHFYPFFAGVRSDHSKIIGGTDADISDFPWQVFFKTGDYRCGGSIIDEYWVVTAAHCTKNDDGTAVPVSEMSIIAGATNPYSPFQGREYLVNEVIAHENYNRRNLTNDIALLRLAQPVDVVNAEPIKLVTAGDAAEGATDPGVMSWITGWGLSNVDPDIFPSSLQKAQVPIVSNQQAALVWGTIPPNIIMAGYSDGNKDVCNGDSGGPMAVPVSGEFKLAGIVSWGSKGCETYSGYTKVSGFENWIWEKTGLSQYIAPVAGGDTLVCQGVASSDYYVEPLPGVSAYEWQLYPEEAGIISGNTANATVSWNLQYIGTAIVKLRITIDNKTSEWSRLSVEVVKNTRLVSQFLDRVLCAQQTLNLAVIVEGHNLKYNWYKNDNLISSVFSGNFQISNASVGNSGDYKCVVTGSCGTVSSDIIKVTVHPLTRITYISPDVTVGFGEDVALDVTAEGYDLTYKWKKNDKLLDYADAGTLMLQDADANDIGLYQAVVSGYCGTEESNRSYVYIKNNDFPESAEVYMWPTSTRDNINVALSTGESYNIRIFTLTGKLVKERKNCRYQTTLTVNDLARGVFIMNVQYGNSRKSLKFFRE